MSFSLFKKFIECEAAAMNKLLNPSEENNATALLVGNYVHSYFESEEAHQDFLNEKEKYIKTRTGTLRSDFVKASKYIKRLQDWKLFNAFYKGEKESIVIGNIGGVQWKGKIDNLNIAKGYFCDIKTVKDFSRIWNPDTHERENFVVNRQYTMQMYIYKTLLEQQYGKEFTPIIFAVTKEEHPDIKAISFQDWDFSIDEQTIQSYLPHVMKVLYGEEKPTRCEKCNFCKDTKQPTDLVSANDF
ncbi:PD-(D/E)XK nuclease-like domain-containing protein [Companilactobacillus sp. DQM5]|uniref:PD-(D/E)XK nuclease-like domain-containing protein n=1 Tax=Companilactobacillus sp. DQM5 TaxID=3463359 RepID=UPI00405A2B8E